ncbi:MAG TPA: zf-HC2 domain-containing protein [Phycisphaerae bacterium]|nr:zf-HC2 domain-containing protein [Phycisphaerae bacterium]
MNCDQVARMLADYLGHELDPADREAFDDHVTVCDKCRAEADSLQVALGALRQLGPPPAQPATTEPLAAPTPLPRSRLRILRPLAYAATLLIGVGIGWAARTAPPAPTVAPTLGPKSPVVAPAIDEQVRPDKLSPFVRNAYALSRAFSQPTRQ